MRPYISFFLLMMLTLPGIPAMAQVCTGSLGDPVVDQTFGATKNLSDGVGPPLPGGMTTLQYSDDPCDEDGGFYGLVSGITRCHAETWQNISHDHTGNTGGYFMLINGPAAPEVVYTQTVSGSTLCPNTIYQFSAYIMNVLKLTPATADWVLPNLTFTIKSAKGQVLKTINTGDIPETTDAEWIEYGTFFTSPSDGSDVLIELADNQSEEGNGNDFAVDDITLSPCGPLIRDGFVTLGDTTSRQTCPYSTGTYQFVGSQQGYDNPVYQWQQNLNDGNGWTDIAGATGTTYTTTLTNPAVGDYQYRMGVVSSANASPSCRIYSQPLSIAVSPLATPIIPTTTICQGQPLQLYAFEGNTFQWTGPNGFTSTVQSPIIDKAAQNAESGLYTVTINFLGCQSTSSTQVTVLPPIQPVVTPDTVICQGTTATLTAAQSQNATTFTWSPSTGLNTTNEPTVTAAPTQTTQYTVELDNGCQPISREVTVTVVSKPTANAGPNKHLLAGDSAELNGTVTGDSVTYYWTPATYLNNPNVLQPVATPPDDIVYTLHAQSAYCGDDTSSVFIRVYQRLTIPNTFTPNNDGINDEWDIKNLFTYPECTVMVFDRYGQQVFQSYGYTQPWNGRYHGRLVPEGTYYYLIDLHNGMPKLSGWLLVVR